MPNLYETPLEQRTGCEVIEFLGIPCVSMKPVSPVPVFHPQDYKYPEVPLFVPIEFFHVFRSNSSLIKDLSFESCYLNGSRWDEMPITDRVIILLAGSILEMSSLVSKLVSHTTTLYHLDVKNSNPEYGGVMAFVKNAETNCTSLFLLLDKQFLLSE